MSPAIAAGPTCQSCLTQLPEFRKHARAVPGGPAQVLAIVSDGETAGLADELSDVAAVAFEARRGPTWQAFSVTTYPAFFALDAEGTITARGPRAEQLGAARAPGVSAEALCECLHKLPPRKHAVACEDLFLFSDAPSLEALGLARTQAEGHQQDVLTEED